MTKPKVDLKLIEQVKEMRLKGKTQEEIGVELGLSQGTVSIILRSAGLGGHLIKKPSVWSTLRRGSGHDSQRKGP